MFLSIIVFLALAHEDFVLDSAYARAQRDGAPLPQACTLTFDGHERLSDERCTGEYGYRYTVARDARGRIVREEYQSDCYPSNSCERVVATRVYRLVGRTVDVHVRDLTIRNDRRPDREHLTLALDVRGRWIQRATSDP